MTVQSAFKSTDPAVVAEFDRWRTERAALNTFARHIEERYGADALDGRQPMLRGSVLGSRLAGFGTNEADTGRNVPRTREGLPGLRLGAKEGYWVPDKRTAEGRALAKEFGQHHVKRPKPSGMPEEIWLDHDAGGSHLYSPGFADYDGVVWCVWGIAGELVIDPSLRGDRNGAQDRAAKVDLDVWEPAALSAYYTAKEAHEAREDAEAPA